MKKTDNKVVCTVLCTVNAITINTPIAGHYVNRPDEIEILIPKMDLIIENFETLLTNFELTFRKRSFKTFTLKKVKYLVYDIIEGGQPKD
jgi:hypothetical protein